MDNYDDINWWRRQMAEFVEDMVKPALLGLKRIEAGDHKAPAQQFARDVLEQINVNVRVRHGVSDDEWQHRYELVRAAIRRHERSEKHA